MNSCSCFLDVANAFDNVWHGDLIFTLIILSIYAELIHLTHLHLSDSYFCVRINSKLFTLKWILICILRSFVLGLILFKLFFNNIPRTLGSFIELNVCDTRNFFKKILTIFPVGVFSDVWNVNNRKTAAIYFYKKLTYPNRITYS